MAGLEKLAGAFATTAFSNATSGLGSALFGEQQARRNWRYRQKEMAKQQEYNLQNMQKQFEYQQEAWRKENSYNAPINAVARWRAAGIAPQAIYGNSPGGAGVAGSMSTPDSSNPSAGGNMDTSSYRPVMTLAEAQAMRNQTRITDAEVRLKDAQSKEAEARASAQEFQNSMQDLLKRAQEAATGIAEAERTLKEVAAKWADAKEAKDMEIKDSILGEAGARIEKLKADKAYQEQATEKLKSDIDLISEQIKTEGSKQRDFDASADLKDAQRKTENLLRMSKKALTDQQARKVVSELVYQKIISNTDAYELAKLLAGLHDPRNLWDGVWRILNLPANAATNQQEFATALYQALYKEINRH